MQRRCRYLIFFTIMLYSDEDIAVIGPKVGGRGTHNIIIKVRSARVLIFVTSGCETKIIIFMTA